MNIIEIEAVDYAEYEFFTRNLNSTVDNLSRDLSKKNFILLNVKEINYFF